MRWLALTLLLLSLVAGLVWLASDRALVPVAGPAVAAEAAPAPAAAVPEPTVGPLPERAAAPAADGVLVRVVDAASQAPMPGAEVFWYGKGVGAPPLSAADHQERATDPEAFHRRRGERVVADAAGLVRLPAIGWFAVVARAGERYGEVQQWQLVPELLLPLHAEQSLTIRTVDAGGRPVAGIAVRFRGMWMDRGKAVEWSALLPASDGAGLTRLPHLQELVSPRIAQRLQHWSLSDGVEWQGATVAAAATRMEGEAVAVDLRRLPAGPVDVVVPAVGSMEFALQGPDGEPFPLLPGPQIAAVLIPDGGMAKPLEPALDARPFGADGRAVFAAVACGRRYELLGRTDWYDGVVFPGPTRPGERIVVPLPIPRERSWLVGRLLGEDGQPWVREVSLRLGSNHLLPGHPEGRFLVPVPGHAGRQPNAWFAADAGRLEASLTFPTPLPDGITDVGAVVLRRPPLLLSGQVVVRGAADPAKFRAGLRAYIHSRDPELAFGRPDRMPVPLDAEGRFAVYATTRNVDYVFYVDGNTLPGAYAKFTPGTAGLEVVAAPGGAFAVSYLVNPQWGMLWVSAQRQGAPPGQSGSSTGTLCASGRVVARFDSLEAGEYEVVATLGPVVADRRKVVVGSGGEVDASGLADIDLRGVVPSIRLTVTDAQGGAIDGTQIGSRPVGAGDSQWAVRDYAPGEGGMPLVADGPVELCVWAPGHRAAQQVVSEVAAIVLQPLPRVTVRWADAPALPAGCVVRLQWERVSSGPQPPSLAGPGVRGAELVREAQLGGTLPWLLADGRAELTAEPGQLLRLRFVLDREGKRSAPFAVVPGELDPGTFVDRQVVELRAAAAAVAAAIELLEGK
jgi:hypothetical protein